MKKQIIRLRANDTISLVDYHGGQHTFEGTTTEILEDAYRRGLHHGVCEAFHYIKQEIPVPLKRAVIDWRTGNRKKEITFKV